MNINELGKQLQSKKRTVEDLARYISTRTDQNPNYTVLLGAGCSISSGVRSGLELVNEWRKELCPNIEDIEAQKQFLKQNYGEWYDPSREYSCLFEKKYDLQRQRRMFVEREVSGKSPSLGYAYLTALVNQGYFNTIFTTNFDDLVNEAFYTFSDQRPIVCAHDSSINSITVTSKRPKIIKLHGDYLFDDIKATSRETESLEQNMKAKFAEFAKDYGLIVVGYAGTDRSIMDVLSLLLKNDDYFKGGVYWCLRNGSYVPEELRKLLWKERVYFVEMEGFDELFAELYCNFNRGSMLPFSTLSVLRKPNEIVSKLLSKGLDETSSPILKKAYDLLLKQSKRATLMNMILPPEKEDGRTEDREISDDDLISQFEVRNLMITGDYKQAIAKGREHLSKKLSKSVRRKILRSIIDAHKFLGETVEVSNTIEELIKEDPTEPAHYLLKADFLNDWASKLNTVKHAIELDPYSPRSYLRKAQLLERHASVVMGPERNELIKEALTALQTGISRDPSLRNPGWTLLFDITKNNTVDRKEREQKLKFIVQKLGEMNPESNITLSLRRHCLAKENEVEIQDFLADVDRIIVRNSPELDEDLESIRLEAVGMFNDEMRTEQAITEAQSKYDLTRNSVLTFTIVSAGGLKGTRHGRVKTDHLRVGPGVGLDYFASPFASSVVLFESR